MLAGFAPSGRVNRGYSDSPQRHRRAGLELQERSAAVAPVTTSLTSVSQGHGMPKRGHSCSSAGGLRSRYGLTPSFPGTLTRCFLTWPELLRPSIARRRIWIIWRWWWVDRRCLQAGQLLLVQLSGDIAARPARLRRMTRSRCIAGGWGVSWGRRRIIRIVAWRIRVIRVLGIQAGKRDADAGIGRRRRNGPSADAESSCGESGNPEMRKQRDIPEAIHVRLRAAELRTPQAIRPKYAGSSLRQPPTHLMTPVCEVCGVAELRCWGEERSPRPRLTASARTRPRPAEAALGTVDVIGRLGAHSLAMDYSSSQRDRANLSRDGSNLRSRGRGDPRSEHSGPSANSPIGRASGSGANRVHSHRAPAQRRVPHLTRSRRRCAKRGPPVSRPQGPDRRRTQGSTSAFLPRTRELAWHCWPAPANKS